MIYIIYVNEWDMAQSSDYNDYNTIDTARIRCTDQHTNAMDCDNTHSTNIKWNIAVGRIE